MLTGTVEVCDGGGAFVRRTSSADVAAYCKPVCEVDAGSRSIPATVPSTRESSAPLSVG